MSAHLDLLAEGVFTVEKNKCTIYGKIFNIFYFLNEMWPLPLKKRAVLELNTKIKKEAIENER
jgi:hypothetical protein